MTFGLKYLTVLSLLAGLYLSIGCVSETIEPEHYPKLEVAQSGDGILTFILTTKLGYKYRIFYLHPERGTWVLLPDCDVIIGTGKTIEFKKGFNPRKELPAFTVRYSKH